MGAQGVANFVAQMLGSLFGAFLLFIVVPKDADRTGGYGSNTLNEDYEWYQAFFGEIICTSLLMFTVLQTAVNEKSAANRAQAALAIGFSVFLAHTVLIPIDGCSINPTRSFGPALIGTIRYRGDDERPMDHAFGQFAVFLFGPLAGAALAVLTYKTMFN